MCKNTHKTQNSEECSVAPAQAHINIINQLTFTILWANSEDDIIDDIDDIIFHRKQVLTSTVR